MAGALKIKTGTKLVMAYDVPIGKEPDFNLICTFGRSIDESAFLVSIPMKNGKALLLDENQKLLIRYGTGNSAMIIAGYPDDEVKEGIRRYWKIRRVSEQRSFFKRTDERIKVALNLEYMQETWPVNNEGTIDKEGAMTLDISAGGAAVFINRHFDIGEMASFDLPRIGTTEEGKAITGVVSQICWEREAPKGSIYKFVCGIQFRFVGTEKEVMKRYVMNLKKKFKIE